MPLGCREDTWIKESKSPAPRSLLWLCTYRYWQNSKFHWQWHEDTHQAKFEQSPKESQGNISSHLNLHMMPLFQYWCFCFFQVYINVWTVLDVLAKALWMAQHFRAIDFQRVNSLHQTASPWEHPWMYRPRTRQSLRHVKTGMFLMDFDRTIYGFDVTYLSQNMMDSKTWWTASTSFLIVKGSLEGLANGHKELCKKTKDYELLLTPWVHCSSIFIFMFKLFLGVFLRDKRRVRVYTHAIAATRIVLRTGSVEWLRLDHSYVGVH